MFPTLGMAEKPWAEGYFLESEGGRQQQHQQASAPPASEAQPHMHSQSAGSSTTPPGYSYGMYDNSGYFIPSSAYYGPPPPWYQQQFPYQQYYGPASANGPMGDAAGAQQMQTDDATDTVVSGRPLGDDEMLCNRCGNIAVQSGYTPQAWSTW